MAKTYLLYETESAWDAANLRAEEHLGIPKEGTSKYAQRHTINNTTHTDYGKHIFPVTPKVADLFPVGQALDANWIVPTE